MIEHLFLNINGNLKEASNMVFASIGLIDNNIKEGDSFNVLGGIYYSYSLLGMSIKLEDNSYDYDDEFNIMLSIRRDTFSDIEVDDFVIKRLAEIIASLLVKNLKIKVAHENDENKLQYFYP